MLQEVPRYKKTNRCLCQDACVWQYSRGSDIALTTNDTSTLAGQWGI